MSDLHVICRIGEAEYAIPAAEVYQMEAYTGATPVPGSAPYVLGLVQVRQQILPLLDLRARLGLAAIEPSPSSRNVVLQLGKRLVGLLVDSAREVQTFAPEQLQPPPDVIATQSAGFVKSVIQLRDRIVLLLDSSRVVAEETVHG